MPNSKVKVLHWLQRNLCRYKSICWTTKLVCLWNAGASARTSLCSSSLQLWVVLLQVSCKALGMFVFFPTVFSILLLDDQFSQSRFRKIGDTSSPHCRHEPSTLRTPFFRYPYQFCVMINKWFFPSCLSNVVVFFTAAWWEMVGWMDVSHQGLDGS